MDAKDIKEITDLVTANMMLCTKEVLTAKEAAAYMGVSMSHLYKLTMQGAVPHYKPQGKMVYFNRAELESWLQSNRVATKAEIADRAQAYCMKGCAMILTDYYKCAELKKLSSHRFDCTASTKSYEPFEAIADRAKVKRFFFYLGNVPEQFNAHAKRRADRALTNGKNLSSLYVPDLNTPLLGYGDARGTKDALLFKFNDAEDELEIFVARGQKHNSRQLFNLFADGELDLEIEKLRHSSQPTNVEKTLFP